ncbi:MAG: dienelactone hydrolase family protein [Desulfomonile tiedjei]|nr:dienelactone hydrolase family protein [Desulfomonile tiedjei]
MKLVLMLMLATLLATQAVAASHKETVEYKDHDVALEGYLSYEDAEGRRPGILVVPDWMGLGEHYRSIGDKLAGLGYVAFVADMYGKGVRPANTQEASALATKYKSDRELMRQRIHAALAELKKNKIVDPSRVAVIGYCFGGTVGLELARSGADIKGVVSFHGGLDTPNPNDAKNIKAKLLVLHGADDPFVPPKEVAAFEDEMRKAGVDWQMIFYGNSVHAFTTPAAGTDNSKGAAYNESANRRSWQAMQSFFKEIFSPGTKS